MIKKGTGIGCMWYGIGNTGSANPAAAFIEVLPDATANLMVGSADIGQGSTTVLAQIAAETLGIDYEDVRVISADTLYTPEGGATSASRQTFVSGQAVMLATRNAKKVMEDVAADCLCEDRSNLIFKHGIISCINNPDKQITCKDLLKEMGKRGCLAVGAGAYNPKTTPIDEATMTGIPYEVYSYATAIAHVSVDTETGEIRVLDVISAHDVGTTINPNSAEGQIEGGVAMGMGFAILEKTEVKNGEVLNKNYSRYLIPTAMDMPNVYPILVETDNETGPFGAKGIGEPALIPVIPAILDAIEDAIGVKFTEVPVTPRDVLRELKNRQ